MKCVSTWTFSWKLEMISDPSPSPPGPGAANPPPRSLGADWQLVCIYILPKSRLTTGHFSSVWVWPETNQKTMNCGRRIQFYFYLVVNIIIVEQTFSTYGHSMRGEEQQHVFIFVQLWVEVAFENKEDMRTQRETEWWQRAGLGISEFK